ncbi:hemerythrin domain-containing protein [Paenibacillus hexagrammi]|uniref:Hemerythrin domain-containing protein n=1 Tax=Paenibacillus hexagrammi TaxID=2908839 RepID=A0ABY3SKM4_9BACL|nr:hemerythrin domain-containing protein [Paenibacillus sp. YPD9-1]UJF34604.1 hemerythrin domain-containing protein [Paenibacillus sp. YPD9-1]
MDIRLGAQAKSELAAHPAHFPAIVQRLKEEHEQMRDQLAEIRTMAVSLYSLTDCSIGMCKLIELQDRILSLVEELEQHSEWEEKELFPLLQSYFSRAKAFSIARSIIVLEQDHDLAKQVVKAYVDGVNAMRVPIDMEFLHYMTAELVRACLLLLKHFTLEEELVYPLINQILSELESASI